MPRKKKEDTEQEENTLLDENEVTENETKPDSPQVILDLKEEIEALKSAANEKEKLQLELDDLKNKANRTGGKPISLEMAKYKFIQILDRGISFTGTFGHPVTEGGRNHYTRYCCDDGAEVELPVKYAKQLNHCSFPEPVWTTDDNGNSIKKNLVNLRWIFTKVEG